MLDINFIRQNTDRVKKAIFEKGLEGKVNLDRLIQLDDKRRLLIEQLNKLRSEKNDLSDQIQDARESKREELIQKSKEIKEELADVEPKLVAVVEEYNKILFKVPNVTAPTMHYGKGEEDNVVVKIWGEKPNFDFKPKTHDILAEDLDLLDNKKAAEISGSRFSFLKGDLVLLQFAIINWVLNQLTSEEFIKQIIEENNLKLSTKPFVPMLPPMMVRREVQKSIHRVHGDQTYRIENDELNLVASAEHTMAPYHMNEVLNADDLPKRYIGYSAAFRREAGTYGKDMKGFFRNHQFDKLELESFTDEKTGEDEQMLMVAIQEKIMQKLGLHYHLIQICTGDTGSPDYNQFDINVWLPGQGRYREVTTSDYMTDYQTRGINSYYTDDNGNKNLLHTNDATAFCGRYIIAIIENYQQKDGSILIPAVLRDYTGKDVIKS